MNFGLNCYYFEVVFCKNLKMFSISQFHFI